MPSNMARWGAMILEITKILKHRFPNLTTEETVTLATQIMEACVGILKAEGGEIDGPQTM